MPDAIVLTTEFHERDRIPLVNLLRAYEKGLGVSLCFQDFDAEIAGLPGDYAPPGGTLVLAHAADGHLVGTVALRALDPARGICEMKRLYVAPEGRGQGLGRRLAERALTEARNLGYRAIRLDTLPSMREAQTLYAALGFRDIASYNGNPIAGTRFLEKVLEQS
jgi:ribosomal protein S18 acetylase RimI-like enzyme